MEAFVKNRPNESLSIFVYENAYAEYLHKPLRKFCQLIFDKGPDYSFGQQFLSDRYLAKGKFDEYWMKSK